MAISVSSFVENASWFNAGSSTFTISWSTNDVIVVLAAQENAANTLTTPTATGLTFTSRQIYNPGSSGFPYAQIWTAKAGGSGSGVTLTSAKTSGSLRHGACAYILSGANDYGGGGVASSPNTNVSLTPPAGAAVLSITNDFNAINFTATASTGSGTSTKRVDVNNTSYFGAYVIDWLGTASGTFSFGLSSYTGLDAITIGVWVTQAAGGSASSLLVPSNRRNMRGLIVR